MEDLKARIRKHWETRGDLRRIKEGLERRGRSIDSLSIDDLAAYDHLHAGVLDASRELAKWADLKEGEDVLDIGSGLGGTARFLAQEHGCHVTALELSPTLGESGRALTEWLGLTERVVHIESDALTWETEWAFDVIVLQHADVQIEEKTRLYGRCRELLSPTIASRVIWHDWLAGPGGEVMFPVPWSGEGEEISFLSTMDEFRADLVSVGLALHRFQTLPAETALWFNAARDRLRKVLEKDDVDDRRQLEGFLEEIEGGLRNVAEARIVPFFAEARRVE